jgi:hypothetical protein
MLRLTTFTTDTDLPSSRSLEKQAPPRLVRIDGPGTRAARWPSFRRYAWG